MDVFYLWREFTSPHKFLPWSSEALQSPLKLYEALWSSMKPSEALWSSVTPSEALWRLLKPSQDLRRSMTTSEALWRPLKLYDDLWSSMTTSEALWSPLRPFEELSRFLYIFPEWQTDLRSPFVYHQVYWYKDAYQISSFQLMKLSSVINQVTIFLCAYYSYLGYYR